MNVPGTADAPEGGTGAEGSRYTLRMARPGDEAGILALFNEVFPVPRTIEQFMWRYRTNPAGLPFGPAALAEAPGGRIVAHYTTTPTWGHVTGLRCHLVQVTDSVVANDYRAGLKKPGLFVEVARFYYDSWWRALAEDREKAEAVGFRPMGYGFPIRTALRIGQRLLGYTPLAPVGSFAATRDELSRRLPRSAAEAAYETRVTAEAGEAADRLWQRCVDELPTATIRDRAYLDWRYRDCPGVRYIFVLARNRFSGEVEGLAVLRPGWLDRPVVAIADWLVPGRVRGAPEALLRATLAVASAESCSEIAAWFPLQFPAAIDAVALGLRPVPSEYWLVASPYGCPITAEEAGPTWYYTLGDSDIV